MEQVFVVRRADFFGGDWPEGFTPIAAPDVAELLSQLSGRGFFTDRDPAEQNPELKQLIPYCVVARDTSPTELLCVQRLAKQGEGRLHGKLSIGLGGHINPQDESGKDLLTDALHRELAEELVLPDVDLPEPRFLGLLNDDATDVGSVHAGLVFLLTVSAMTEIRIRETDKMHGEFRPAQSLVSIRRSHPETGPSTRVVESDDVWQHARFESWSETLLDAGPWAGPVTSRRSTSGVVNREESRDG